MVRPVVSIALVLCAVFVAALAGTAPVVNPQLDALWGHYWSDCQPFGQQGSGLTAKHFDVILNNGFMSRFSLWVNNPQCQGGFDITFTRFGVINYGVGNVTNTVGATNFDFGQDFKDIFAVTGAGAVAMNTICNTNIFNANQHTDVTQLDCPIANLRPFSVCPMHYTIAQLSGNTLQLGLASCSAATRPTDFTNSHALIRFEPLRLEGLWQRECTWDATRGLAWSSEMQVLPGGWFSLAAFAYSSAACRPDALVMKMNTAGMLQPYQPETNAPPGSFDVEFARVSHTLYITSPAQLDAMNALTNTPQCGNVQFQLNTLADVRNVTCPAAFLVSVQSCPIWYDIAAVSGNTLFTGQHPQQAGVLCSPAARPTALNAVGAVNLLAPAGGVNGVAVVLALFVVGLVLAGAWIVYKHRGHTPAAVRALCCGSAASYTETA